MYVLCYVKDPVSFYCTLCRQLEEPDLIVQQHVLQIRSQQHEIENLAEQVAALAQTVDKAAADLAAMKQLQQVGEVPAQCLCQNLVMLMTQPCTVW
jgi:cellobiose phosphorylase